MLVKAQTAILLSVIRSWFQPAPAGSAWRRMTVSTWLAQIFKGG